MSGRESALQPMRRFAGQYKNQSIYGLGAQVSISAASRPYFVTAGYLRQLINSRPTSRPAARTDGWLPSHGRLAALPPVRCGAGGAGLGSCGAPSLSPLVRWGRGR